MSDNIKITRAFLPPLEEYVEEIRGIWDTHLLTNMGEIHQRFQRELKAYLNVEQLELFTNGHMAIELSLQALNMNDGEIITTPFTFASTTHAIVRNRFTPVFCDIDPIDFTLDPNKLENLITDKTVAILPVHVYGNICQVEKIQEVADRHGLKVLYDAAHTFGEIYKGKSVGSFGDASCFSFHATKVFNSIEGGAVCFNDPEFGERIRKIRNFGIRNEEEVDEVGPNAKMNEFCAAMGICNLRYLDQEIEKRRVVAERYRKNLEGVKGIRLNPIQKDVKYNYIYFPIVIEKDFEISRDTIYEKLLENGIWSNKRFYPLTSAMKCYRGIFDSTKTPIALDISKRILLLPLYSDLELNDVDRICQLILKQ